MRHFVPFIVVVCFIATMFSADNTPFSYSEALVEMLNQKFLQPYFTRTEAYALLRVCKFFNTHVTKYRDDNSEVFQKSPKLLTNGMKIDDGVVFDVSGNIAYGVHIPKPELNQPDVFCCFTYPALRLIRKSNLPNFSKYIVHHETTINQKGTLGCLVAFDATTYNVVFYSSHGKILILEDKIVTGYFDHAVKEHDDGSMRYSKEFVNKQMIFSGDGKIDFCPSYDRIAIITIAADGTAKGVYGEKMNWKAVTWDA